MADQIPFGKPLFAEEEIAAVTRVLQSGWIGMGPETIAFEQELEDFLDVESVVTVNSCTSALFLSLKVLGVGPGDEVICPSFTWCSTANAAIHLGASPVFCDIDPETFCITPEAVKAAITPKTKAVIIVHYGGYAVDPSTFRAVIPEHIAIVEDAAHAIFSKYPDNSPVGSKGNLTCFSFYANKNLSTGEGGAVATNHSDYAERIKRLRLHGLNTDAWQRYMEPNKQVNIHIDELGYKMNYTDLQAAIGRVQLKKHPQLIATRKSIATLYAKAMDKLAIRYHKNILTEQHSRHLFPILLPFDGDKKNEFIQQLKNNNIGVSIHYNPLHLLEFYQQYNPKPLPVTEDIFKRIVTLPISSSISTADAHFVVEKMTKLIQHSDKS